MNTYGGIGYDFYGRIVDMPGYAAAFGQGKIDS